VLVEGVLRVIPSFAAAYPEDSKDGGTKCAAANMGRTRISLERLLVDQERTH
jgi:hypothetical protein